MNRRNLFRILAGGIAAACGVAVTEKEPPRPKWPKPKVAGGGWRQLSASCRMTDEAREMSDYLKAEIARYQELARQRDLLLLGWKKDL